MARKRVIHKTFFIKEENDDIFTKAEEIIRYTLRSNFSEWVTNGVKRLVDSKGRNQTALGGLDSYVDMRAPATGAPGILLGQPNQRDALEPLDDKAVVTIMKLGHNWWNESQALLKKRGFRDSDIRRLLSNNPEDA